MATNSRADNKTATTEADVIRLAQTGDEEAFGELYQRNLNAIFRYIQQRVNDMDEVENLTQVVFVKAWQALERYQPTKVPFRAWLYRIAGNTVIDYYRTHKETIDIDSQWRLVDGQASPEEMLLSGERSETIHSAINQLKPSYQQVISLRFMEERDYPEAALVLDRQVNAVRVLQHRALGALQKVLTSKQVSWIVTMAAVLTLALGGGIALAAEGSLPGDTLYPVKRTLETAILRVADDALDLRLHATFANRRIDEMSRLLDPNQEAELAMAADQYAGQISALTANLLRLLETDPEQVDALVFDVLGALKTQSQRLSVLSSHGSDSAIMPAIQQSIAAAHQAKMDIEQLTPTKQQPTLLPSSTSIPRTRQSTPEQNSAQEQGAAPPRSEPTGEPNDPPSSTGSGFSAQSDLEVPPAPAIADPSNNQHGTSSSTSPHAQPSTVQSRHQGTSAPQRNDGRPDTTDLFPPAASIVQALLTNLELGPRPQAPFSAPRVVPIPGPSIGSQMPLHKESPVPSDESIGQNSMSPPKQDPQSQESVPSQQSGETNAGTGAPSDHSQSESNASGGNPVSDVHEGHGREEEDPQGNGHPASTPSSADPSAAQPEPEPSQAESPQPDSNPPSNALATLEGDDSADNAGQNSPNPSQGEGNSSSNAKGSARP